MYWIAIGLSAAALAGAVVWYLRFRWRSRHRLISLVALLKEPITFDPAVLASVAGKTWHADLGDGSTAGTDGYVVCGDTLNTIMHDGRYYLLNAWARPYVDNAAAVAEAIPDLRIRSLFRDHQAWFSCDALGVDGSTPETEVLESYRRLGKLFAELLDDNCLLIFVPDSNRAYPINEDTEAALRSNDPIQALQQTLTVPIIQVSDDDPLMREAVSKAQENWSQFAAAFEGRSGENFSVKAPVTHGENTEFIWIAVTALEGERIYGELANDPNDLGPLKLGSKVSVLATDLNDWCFIDREGNLAGGFTIEAVTNAARAKRS
jgi:uncharacterized protein YegJ (DUF2314 family)